MQGAHGHHHGAAVGASRSRPRPGPPPVRRQSSRAAWLCVLHGVVAETTRVGLGGGEDTGGQGLRGRRLREGCVEPGRSRRSYCRPRDRPQVLRSPQPLSPRLTGPVKRGSAPTRRRRARPRASGRRKPVGSAIPMPRSRSAAARWSVPRWFDASDSAAWQQGAVALVDRLRRRRRAGDQVCDDGRARRRRPVTRPPATGESVDDRPAHR